MRIRSLEQWRVGRDSGRFAVRMLLGLMTCGLVACTSARPPAGNAGGDQSTVETYMAISGGGWRAHTAQAAWTMGLLRAARDTSPSPESVNLGTVFGSVSGISSNSGGSWFNTMLAYSNDFRAAIEDPRAINNYSLTTGYLGKQHATLTDSTCAVLGRSCGQSSTRVTCFECNVRRLTNEEYTTWTNVVDHVVFEPYGMAKNLATTRLSGTRQTWAAGKSLILAATMLTDNVVVNGWGSLGEIYYQVTTQPGVPQQFSVTPVAFASLPAGSPLAPPDFFLAGDMELKYASNISWGPPSATANRPNLGLKSDVLVLAAAASSSAAAGAQASETVEAYQGARVPWTDAYEASGLAPGFTFDHDSLTPATATNGTPPKALSEEEFIRLADGGFLDNSAVAHLINFLQKNKKPTFNIIAFDNVQQSYAPPNLAGTQVPVDIAYLFGEGPPNVPLKDPKSFDPTVFCGGTFMFWNLCLKVPLQQVFDSKPLMTTPASWTHTCGGNKLSYTKYAVTTVDNPTLGVTGNMKGWLHVFAAIFPDANTTPNRDAADWHEYGRMLDCIYDGMANQGGAAWFRRALLSAD
jgi:hypothetical protein